MNAHVANHRVLAGFSREALADPQTLLTQPCDILVPAALERVIDGSVASKLRCRVLAEGANGPTTPEADLVLAQREKEIFVVPDILCNSGGVVVSYFEWVQDLQQFFWEENEVNHRLTQVLDRAFHEVVVRAERDGVGQRTAAMAIGVEKVYAAKKTRGLFRLICGCAFLVGSRDLYCVELRAGWRCSSASFSTAMGSRGGMRRDAMPDCLMCGAVVIHVPSGWVGFAEQRRDASTTLIQQASLCFQQILGVEAFGEPAVHRGKQIICVLAFALALPQSCQAGRRVQLPGFRLLATGPVEGRSKIPCASFTVALKRERRILEPKTSAYARRMPNLTQWREERCHHADAS